MNSEEKTEYNANKDNERWVRSLQGWRSQGSPFSGMKQPYNTMYLDGVIKVVPFWEYLSGPCSRCEYVDNYCVWDKRFRKNRMFCQTCFAELKDWVMTYKFDVDFDINNFLDTKPVHHISPVAER
jgi:hypothetical protein